MGAERILVIAHGHPDFVLGGGELAAWRLFQTYLGQPGVQAAWFLARADRERGATGAITLRRAHEYLWEQGVGDWHLLRAANPHSTATQFTELLQALQPTVVHVHHYAHLGLEMLRTLRRVLPHARIVLTLHEFMAICQNDGQMLTRDTRQLCARESPDDCHRCFPAHTPEDFWLRKQFVLRHFDAVDAFVAPSHFLRERYVQWGLAPERITVIENGQARETPLSPRPLQRGEARRRFGFFGQVNPYKGLDLLLEALAQLDPARRQRLVLEVHCAHLERQSDALRERIQALAAPLIAAGTVVWCGPYRPEELRGRMASVDWVVVPSRWWENSPLVIQEAFNFGRPVVCADIGGMAEKVRHGIDGWHVPAGHVKAWGDALAQLADAHASAGLWESLARGIRRPLAHADCAQAHLALFAQLATSRTQPSPGVAARVVVPLHPVARAAS